MPATTTKTSAPASIMRESGSNSRCTPATPRRTRVPRDSPYAPHEGRFFSHRDVRGAGGQQPHVPSGLWAPVVAGGDGKHPRFRLVSEDEPGEPAVGLESAAEKVRAF